MQEVMAATTECPAMGTIFTVFDTTLFAHCLISITRMQLRVPFNSTFLHAELLQLLRLLLLAGLDGERRRLLVDLPQQRILHAHGAKVPASDEATADEVRAKRHDLAHKHRGQDVGQLVDDPHRGIHVCG